MKKYVAIASAFACCLALALLAGWSLNRTGAIEQATEDVASLKPLEAGNELGAGRRKKSSVLVAKGDRVQHPNSTITPDRGMESSEPETAQEVLGNGGTFADALAVAAASIGTESPRFASMNQQAYLTCWAHSHLLGNYSANLEEDETRNWASENFETLCTDYDKGQYEVEVPLDIGMLPPERQGGKDAAIENALRTIAISPFITHVSTAGRVLFNEQWPEFVRIPPISFAYGPQELILAWDQAVDLALCDELLGCGPNSPTVATFCIEHGCEPGYPLLEVYRTNLAPPDFAATLAYANWIDQQRAR